MGSLVRQDSDMPIVTHVQRLARSTQLWLLHQQRTALAAQRS
ncbi:MAG: hypothetical protein AAFQ74_10965 [Cyanobacteria bacterium J06623_4]